MAIPIPVIEPFREHNPFSVRHFDMLNAVGELAARYGRNEQQIEEVLARIEVEASGASVEQGTIAVLLNLPIVVVRTIDRDGYVGPIEWEYQDWKQVTPRAGKSKGDPVLWELTPGGATNELFGPLRNLREIDQGTEEVTHGSGYTYLEIPPGFLIRPIPFGSYVMAKGFQRQDDPGAIDYWMDIPNKLGGQCP